MKSFLFDQDYFIDIWKTYIHVFGIVDIDTLSENTIILLLETFKLNLKGESFRVLKLTKNEILIEGKLESIGVIK